jgi:RNA polymerase sigma-70 factor, ECF subfamily
LNHGTRSLRQSLQAALAEGFTTQMAKRAPGPAIDPPEFSLEPCPGTVSSAVFSSMESNDPTPSEEMPARAKRDSAPAASPEQAAWGELLAGHRDRLRRMIALRLDERLRGRIDPSDVIQEAFLEATARQAEYAREADPMPPFLWLRFLTLQRLQITHRRHLGTRARDAGREISVHGVASPAASSAAIAAHLLGRETRPSEALMRAERKLRLQEALNAMDVLDREVIVLRNFEQLTNQECARVLGLAESAATKRYIRALKRLKEILTSLPDAGTGFWR